MYLQPTEILNSENERLIWLLGKIIDESRGNGIRVYVFRFGVHRAQWALTPFVLKKDDPSKIQGSKKEKERKRVGKIWEWDLRGSRNPNEKKPGGRLDKILNGYNTVPTSHRRSDTKRMSCEGSSILDSRRIELDHRVTARTTMVVGAVLLRGFVTPRHVDPSLQRNGVQDTEKFEEVSRL